MKKERTQTFYNTSKLVQKGDEFYEIVLEEREGGKFRAKMFHGSAGRPPGNPEEDQSFVTRAAAEQEFERLAKALEAKGFEPYNWLVHGPNISF